MRPSPRRLERDERPPTATTRPNSARSSALVVTPRPPSSSRVRGPRDLEFAARKAGADWVAPQDVEDAKFVQRELDMFETYKVRQLAPTLNKPADAVHLDLSKIVDKEAHHRARKAQLALTGGRRPGSKANDVVIFHDEYFRKYANPIETGKTPFMVWLRDIRALRVHPYVLSMRALQMNDANMLLDVWFKHSKQNTQLTMTNAHTALRGFIAELLAPSVTYADVAQCQSLYDRLNDRKHGTMDYAPAMAKLQVLLGSCDETCWETYAQHFFSGALSFIADTDFISAFELSAIISLFETLLEETEASLKNVPRRQVPKPLRQILQFCKADVAEFALLQPTDRMLTKPEALSRIRPGGCLAKLLNSGAYEESVRVHAARGENKARLKKQAERNALLSRISKMRLPVEELRKARTGSVATGGAVPVIPDKPMADEASSGDDA